MQFYRFFSTNPDGANNPQNRYPYWSHERIPYLMFQCYKSPLHFTYTIPEWILLFNSEAFAANDLHIKSPKMLYQINLSESLFTVWITMLLLNFLICFDIRRYNMSISLLRTMLPSALKANMYLVYYSIGVLRLFQEWNFVYFPNRKITASGKSIKMQIFCYWMVCVFDPVYCCEEIHSNIALAIELK